jgi:hypothetical protein
MTRKVRVLIVLLDLFLTLRASQKPEKHGVAAEPNLAPQRAVMGSG